MKYKSMIILALTIFVLISIAGVSAADANDTAIASEDAGEIDLSANSVETDNLKANNNNCPIVDESIDDNLEDRIHDDFALGANENSVLSEGEAGSFTDLNKFINVDNKDNDTITLNGNYKYVSGDEDFITGINIARSLTIDGNGATLDGSNSARIFWISTSDKVTLKNINFINGKAEGSNSFYSQGGAILDNSGCTIENCHFTNNYASYDGGAVYGHNTATILRNCTFTQNRVIAIGGAASQSSAINCTFNENKGRYGGALGVSNALNCIFNGNSGKSGGAMYLGNAALCTFKTDSDTTYDTNIDNATLSISNLNNEYNFGDKLIFDLKGAGLHCDGMNVKINIYYPSGDLMGTYYGLTGKDGGLIINFDYGEYLAKLSLEGYEEVENVTATINVIAGTTFSDLNKVINGNTNSTIILDKNYTYNSVVDSAFTEGIVIDRPVTINGNSYTINANGKARIFLVTSDNVVLENITFVNGNGFNGGAVYFFDSGSVINCNFTNNTGRNGGAISFQTEATVTNCSFTNNSATRNGGAIEVDGIGNVSNCNFTGNNASSNGGAIYFGYPSTGEIINCNFIDNKVTGDESCGGAVYFRKNGEVTNCSFTNNSATRNGGAIYFDEDTTGRTINCNFTNNTGRIGGAVYFWYQGTLINCTFTGNKATGDDSLGGAVYFYKNSEGNVTNCSFTNNSATKNGGAIYFAEGSNGRTINCNFTDNSAGYGGAVYFYGNGNVTNCNFTNNSATKNGGAIYMNLGSIENCNFTDNTATKNGGAVYLWYNCEVMNCNFTNNKATRGGAIDMGSGTVTNCNFTNNKAAGDPGRGGAIYMSSGSVENCNFVDNKATSYGGGAIYMSSGTITNCNFTGNNATGDGGAVYFYGNGNVTNCNFADNTAYFGGAVFFLNTGNVTKCNFTDNTASDWGGAVYFNVNGDVTKCNFTNNSARYGGAVYFLDEGTVKNCNFTDNTASDWGGAVYFNVNGDVTNCNFTNNSARYGGAVYFLDEGTVKNCNFTNNTATYYGGALYMYSGSVENCNFTGNNATTGSAIYFYITSATKTVSNSRFLNNRANSETLEVTKNDNNITITFTGNDNLLNAIYSRNDAEVTFTNVTYWSANGIANTGSSPTTPARSKYEAGQNITVGVVVNDKLVLNEVKVTDENGMIVLDISAGENYYISLRHDTDSYYTEAEKTISNNTKFNVNITSQTTHNKTVNITAKSNIFSEFMEGKLLFIVPNSDSINATYAGNGTWWTVYTFGDYGDYQVNATYSGLDNVTVNNATISISKTPTEITLVNETVNLFVGNSINSGAALTPAVGNLTFTSNNESVAKVENGNIIAVGEGSAVVTVSFAGSDNYAPAKNKTISVTVNFKDASVSVNNDTLDLLVGDEFAIVATTTPEGLNVSFLPDDSGVYSIDENGNVIALRDGDGSILVKVGGDGIYALNSTIVNVTVSKVPTEITVLNDTLVLEVGDEIAAGATLTPGDAGNVTFTSSDEDLVLVEDDGNVIANGKGQAIITVSFSGNDKYAAVNKTINVTVKLNNANVTVDKDTLDLKVDETYQINATKNPDTILLDITYTSNNTSVASVDKNGIVRAVGEGTAIITLSVGDDEIYAKNSTNITVTVKKSTPKLTANAKTFKNTDKTKKYTVTLKNSKGKPIANAQVSLKVNGKTYTAKTNSKGQATFKLTKLTKTGTYTATVKYAGDKKHAAVSAKAKITVKSTWKTIAKGSNYHSMVKKIQIALKNKGYYQTYNGHYLKVDGIFNTYTEMAVMQFQKASGLKVTGKVDYNTAKKLGITK